MWHEVCVNSNLDVVQLIFSLNGVQSEILNVFVFAFSMNHVLYI